MATTTTIQPVSEILLGDYNNDENCHLRGLVKSFDHPFSMLTNVSALFLGFAGGIEFNYWLKETGSIEAMHKAKTLRPFLQFMVSCDVVSTFLPKQGVQCLIPSFPKISPTIKVAPESLFSRFAEGDACGRRLLAGFCVFMATFVPTWFDKECGEMLKIFPLRNVSRFLGTVLAHRKKPITTQSAAILWGHSKWDHGTVDTTTPLVMIEWMDGVHPCEICKADQPPKSPLVKMCCEDSGEKMCVFGCCGYFAHTTCMLEKFILEGDRCPVCFYKCFRLCK
jgi:hypothetical protein